MERNAVVLKNAVMGDWVKHEATWGEFVVKVPTNKYDFRERARVDADDYFKLTVGGRAFIEAKNWKKGEVKDIEIEVHGEPFKHNDEWKYAVKMSFEGFVTAKENPFSGKKEETKKNDVPF